MSQYNDIINFKSREELEEEAIGLYKETVDLHLALDKVITKRSGKNINDPAV
jgi:hypothetical protein